uniref:GCN5-related N-acetyltransferase n=1 Tax=mine drainage metagenome TaxID=410659 RepID=E6Q1F4_9ZZZZ
MTSNDNSGARLRIRIVPLDPSLHDRKSFQCGNDAVDRYLRTTAAQATRYYCAATFILVTVDNPSEVLGYYTLAPHEYRDGELDLATARTLKVHGLQRIPVLLLGQLELPMRK